MFRLTQEAGTAFPALPSDDETPGAYYLPGYHDTPLLGLKRPTESGVQRFKMVQLVRPSNWLSDHPYGTFPGRNMNEWSESKKEREREKYRKAKLPLPRGLARRGKGSCWSERQLLTSG